VEGPSLYIAAEQLAPFIGDKIECVGGNTKIGKERMQGKEIPAVTLKKIIKLVRQYVFQFYEWRKIFELKKHYIVYRQSICKQCGNKVVRKKTGTRKRISFVCSHCQK
jgi:formamidopyrimidine-DNA glycosylase